MCEPTTLTMAALSATSMAASAAASAKAQAGMITAQRKNAIAMMKKANMDNANARLQQVDKAEAARHQMTELNLDKLQTLGTLNTAIGESGLEGRSMDRLKNTTESEYIRKSRNVTENYERDYASLHAQMLGTSLSTHDNIKTLQSQEPSKGARALSGVASALQVGAGAYSIYKGGK
ncbi:internal virion protein C [Pasteurella phage vB_PmuP_Pa7]|uniref:Internal virion protein C n=1 Tax=Pasteurella phage vB_PmuP_Pa7 TaxID=2767198 RepID=A0A7G8ZYS0_9CAUD|nr:internal virion protein C [Pasteurella phage vB_PmuP_Pa7]